MEAVHSCATTRLTGDWTIMGVVRQATRLTQSEINDGYPATVVVDCSGIDDIDMNGFELLYFWLHCIRLRGLRPVLKNIPECMRVAQQRLGINALPEIE